MAVGLAIGTQVAQTVKAIVDGFINPIVGFILGSTDGLNDSKWHIVTSNNGGRTLTIGWGEIVASLITLMAVSAVIYYLIIGLKLDKLDKKSEEALSPVKKK